MIEVHDLFAPNKTDQEVIHDWAFMAKQSHVEFQVRTYFPERASKMLKDGTLPPLDNVRIVMTTSELANGRPIKRE